MARPKGVKKETKWGSGVQKGNDLLIRLSIEMNALGKISRRNGISRRDAMELVHIYLDSQGSKLFPRSSSEIKPGVKRFLLPQPGAPALTPEGYQIVLSVIFALRNGLALQKSRRKILA